MVKTVIIIIIVIIITKNPEPCSQKMLNKMTTHQQGTPEIRGLVSDYKLTLPCAQKESSLSEFL